MQFAERLFEDRAYADAIKADPTLMIGVVGSSDGRRREIVTALKNSAAQVNSHGITILGVESADALHAKKEPQPFEGRPCTSPLKTDWVTKHQSRVFSAIVVLFDWDECSHPDRVHFQTQVLNRVEAVRARVKNSHTPILLALHTLKPRGPNFPSGGSFNNVEEAHVVLRHHCNLDSKHLCLIYQNGMDQYSNSLVVRGALDAGTRFHRDEITRIKRNKSELGRTQNPAFYVARHRFKCGWHALVLRDAKAMLHNFEKTHAMLRTVQGLPTLDSRIVASIARWHMTSNAIGAAVDARQELLLVEPHVAAFLDHMHWMEQPLPVSVGSPVQNNPSGVATANYTAVTSNSSFLSTSTSFTAPNLSPRSPTRSGPAVDNFNQLLEVQANALSDEEGFVVRIVSLHWFIAEMYHRMGRLLARATKTLGSVASSELPIHMTPAYHLEAAMQSMHALRAIVHKASLERAALLAEDGGAPINPETPPKRLAHLGFDDNHPPSLLDRTLFISSATAVSDKLHDIIGELVEWIPETESRRRLTLQLQRAEHEAFKSNYAEALTILERVLEHDEGPSEENPGSSPQRWPLLSLTVNILCMKCCKKLAARDGWTAETASRALRCSLSVWANPNASPAHRTAALEILSSAEASALVGNQEVPLNINHYAAMCPVCPIHCAVSFGAPFSEAHSAVDVRATLRTSALGEVVGVAGCSLELSALGAAMGQSRKRQTVPLPDCTTELSATSGQQSPFTSITPWSGSGSVTFTEAHLVTVEALRIIMSLKHGDQATELHLRLPLPAPADYQVAHFEHRRYDFSYDRVYASAVGETGPVVHRPMVRVVPPVALASLTSSQGVHAIEGEDYPVTVELRSLGDTIEAGVLSIPYMHDLLELVAGPNDGEQLEQPFDNPERPYCMLKLPATVKPGETFTYTISFRCLRAGKFEVPVRLDYATNRCPVMVMSHTVRLHVCHPVFVHFSVFDSNPWDVSNSTTALTRVDAVDPEVLPLAVASHATQTMFVESSELRVEDVHHSTNNASFDGNTQKLLLAAQAVAAAAADQTAAALLANAPAAVTAQLYSVNRTQIPGSNGMMAALVLRSGVPFTVTSQFTNSLQCPVRIHSVNVALPEGLAGMEVLSTAAGEVAGLPCTLGVDEELTVALTLRYTGPKLSAKTCVGSALLVLSRVDEADQEVPSGPEIEFQLPLPEAEFVTAPVSATIEYPSIGNVGEPFPITVTVTNNGSSTAKARVSTMLPTSQSHDKGDAYTISGRLHTGAQLKPGGSRRVVLKVTPMKSGIIALPPIVVTANDTTVLRQDETRSLFVYPKHGAMVPTGH